MTREEIKSARKLRKLSQAALGKLADLTASEISRIECGYRDLNEVEAAAIAEALGLEKKPAIEAPVLRVPGMAAAQNKSANAEIAPASAVQPAINSVVSKPLPTGSDLNDPANFGVRPDLALLTSNALNENAFRARLSAAIARANAILHTPRVPAAVWRAWRQFEQQAAGILRGNETPVIAVPLPVPVKLAAPVASATAESKSFNSLFVEAARSLLSPEVTERINRAAETARHEDASAGFMKHFRCIAETELDPALLNRVMEEANQRLASPERWRTRRGRGRSSEAAK